MEERKHGSFTTALMVIAVLLLSGVIVFGSFIYFRYAQLMSGFESRPARSYEEVFLNNWSVRLPEGMEEQFYEADAYRFGDSDGVRYASFSFDDDSVGFTENFKTGAEEEVESEFAEYMKLAEFSVPYGFLPNFELDYKHKRIGRSDDLDKCLLLYFPEQKEMKIIEVFF